MYVEAVLLSIYVHYLHGTQLGTWSFAKITLVTTPTRRLLRERELELSEAKMTPRRQRS